MTKKRLDRDDFREDAPEEVTDAEAPIDPLDERSLEHAREDAQGVEVFEDPDAAMTGRLLQEGAPGHQSLTGSHLERDDDEDDERGR